MELTRPRWPRGRCLFRRRRLLRAAPMLLAAIGMVVAAALSSGVPL